MAIGNRVGRTPSVEEALTRDEGGELHLAPAIEDFDELEELPYAGTGPAAIPDAQVLAAAPVQAPPPAPAPASGDAVGGFAPVAEPPVAEPPAAEPPAAGQGAVSTQQLLSTLRSRAADAVRRLDALPGEQSMVDRQHEIEGRAAALAATIVADAAASAERAVLAARREREAILTSAIGEAENLVNAGRAEHDALIAAGQGKAQSIVEQADVELARRLQVITQSTDAIVAIAESASGRLAAGDLTTNQLARFIEALSTATVQALSGDQQSGEGGR